MIRIRTALLSILFIALPAAISPLVGKESVIATAQYDVRVRSGPSVEYTQISSQSESQDMLGTVLVNLRFRSGPGTEYAQIGLIPPGTVIPVHGRNDDATWLYATYNEIDGWVAAQYVELNGAIYDLPVVEVNGEEPPQPPPEPTEPPPQYGYTVTITGVGLHTREIFQYGQELGNYPNRFTKVGDSETALPKYLAGFDNGSYLLGTWGHLESAIDYFQGSFEHQSEAAMAGLTINALLDPVWADPELCPPDTNLLECEYQLYKPSVALILLRIHGGEGWEEKYESYLEQVIVTSLEHGVIPVLTMQFRFKDYPAASDEMNVIIRELGAKYEVPVWDLYISTVKLPGYGVDDTNHLTTSPYNNFDFNNPENLQYGKVVHNLEALQILHMLMHQVILNP
jgi:uncharacterized protein YraI